MESEPNMQLGPFRINIYQHEPHNKQMQTDAAKAAPLI